MMKKLGLQKKTKKKRKDKKNSTNNSNKVINVQKMLLQKENSIQ